MNNTIKILAGLVLTFTLAISCKSDPAMSKKSTSTVSTEATGNSFSKDSMEIANKMKARGEKVDGDQISKKLRQRDTPAAKVPTDGNTIPSVCELLKPKLVADQFDVREADVLVTNGKRREIGNNSNKSCFWRWTGGGILVQISKNPLPGEIPNWTGEYMNAKRNSGERNIEGGKTSKYSFTDFNGPGTENLSNHDLGRYYSVYKDKFIVALIFNYNMPEKEQKKVAKELLASVFENLG